MNEQESPSPTFGLQAAGETPKPQAESIVERPNDIGGEHVQDMNARMYADKYKDADSLEAGYLELQSKLSEEKPSTSQMDIDGILSAANVNNNEVIENWTRDGNLTSEQYDGFSKIGLSKEVVDTFLRGQVAVARNGEYAQEQMKGKAEDMVGGAEQWESMAGWAGDHYSEEQIDSINAKLANPKTYEGAIKEMLWDFKMESGQGFTQPLVQGQAAPNTSTGFNDVNEFIAAMGKVRGQGYADEAFKRRLSNTPQHIINGVSR
jgi:hypothetical protein